MGTPLLIDIDGDSLRDVVAPSQSGEVWAIHGENGHIVDNWPFYVEGRSFFASPLAVCSFLRLFFLSKSLLSISLCAFSFSV